MKNKIFILSPLIHKWEQFVLPIIFKIVKFPVWLFLAIWLKLKILKYKILVPFITWRNIRRIRRAAYALGEIDEFLISMHYKRNQIRKFWRDINGSKVARDRLINVLKLKPKKSGGK